MPIYEYECTQCAKVMDVLQKISDPPLEKCRFCGGAVHKVMSQTTFHLKGGGWYVTDYGGSKAPVSPSAETSTPSVPDTD
ncbi:zinc ribbon domain-containing protein [Desulfobotulus sp. H1]|uniref:Zinc ribbon domain-containing protein n=1 Tax=Desulfobotulus pelophilus TaxID=2823377 RepID=A0ABT3N5K8_9BACT|nr:FmdB family zinc ribbon protein [Desulfobotulus pelophilus]MCW7752742.1 zinc ribbon domain-containing protein [Desulfobotulus pelophilus]